MEILGTTRPGSLLDTTECKSVSSTTTLNKEFYQSNGVFRQNGLDRIQEFALQPAVIER